MIDRERQLGDVYVTNVMTTSVATIGTDASAIAAAERLHESDIGSLLVDADPSPPAGIVTESDFVELVATGREPTATTVGECMSAPVVTVAPSASVGAAAETMAEHDVKKLPVLADEGDELLGIVTTTDVATYVPVYEFHPEDAV
jgi:CBS domain-containing protein